MRADIILDGQWGSTGKGKLAAYLARRMDYSAVVCEYGPNTGHTAVISGEKFVFKVLPVGSLFCNRVYLSPDCVFEIPQLVKELKMVREFRKLDGSGEPRVFIHPLAAIVTPEAIEWEARELKRISSTLKGAGATRAIKSMRTSTVRLAKDEEQLNLLVDPRWEEYFYREEYVLGETSQGFDLSMNWGHTYPYCTGRDITLASSCNALGIHPDDLGDVWGSIRTYPIRVGNTADGHSGPHYPDQEERQWSDLGVEPETTTVTGKIRRVFTFSINQLAKFAHMNRPNRLFVNFVNYLKGADNGKSTLKDWEEWCYRAVSLANQATYAVLGKHLVPEVYLLGTGADDFDMVEL